MESTHERLASAYQRELASLPSYWLDQSRKHEAELAHLSGLFLPGTSPEYERAAARIMVVGRETRRWEIIKPGSPFTGLDEYVQRAMAIHQKYLHQGLDKRKADKGESFFNFLRKLRQQDEGVSIAWANLFSFAWQRGSPMRWGHIDVLKKISKRLLETQITILQPDIIIFANGASSAGVRQEYFPHDGENSVCSELGDYREHGIPNNQLWRFRLFGSIQCYRIQHPSSARKGSRTARRFLLDTVLPQHLPRFSHATLRTESNALRHIETQAINTI